MARKKTKTSSKRTQLLETAWRLFYRDGYRTVGIDTLLAEADVAKMTLYHHFASKDELVVAVVKKRSEEILAGLAVAVEEAGKSPERRLLAVFDWLGKLFGSRDFRGCAFVRAISEYPDTEHPVHRAAWTHKSAVRKFLVRLAREAGAKDPAALADHLRLLIDGALVAAHATGKTSPAKTARLAAAELLRAARR
ncbi:MAG: TetR/AcrR family transcriptional regulator [Chthoniobacterales bacterium]